MRRQYVPVFLALCDSAALVAYIANFNPAIAQAAMLGLKICALPWLFRRDSIAVQQARFLFLLYATCALSLIFSVIPTFAALAQNVGFLAHLTFTLFLRVDELRAYLRTLARAITASAVIYLGMAATGHITNEWGRLNYFGGLQPNLGAEIGAMGVLSAALSMRYWALIIYSVPLFASAIVTQGRAAIVCMVLALAFRSAREVLVAGSRQAKMWMFAIVPIGMVVAIAAAPKIISAMMLDDANRGVGTGFVGRTERWSGAIDAFINHPLTGQGLGSFTALDLLSPHDFFLYGIGEMGLLFFPVVVMLSLMVFRAVQYHGPTAGYLSSVSIMLLMNDRFMNLNVYPFLVWVLLFGLSARPNEWRAATSRQPGLLHRPRAGNAGRHDLPGYA